MLYRVITASRSSALSEGLTYEGPDGITPGSSVRVPLRKGFIEGVIQSIVDRNKEETFDVKQIQEVLGDAPLVPEAQLRTASWISLYYMCSLKQALSLFLPPTPWKSVFKKKKKSEDEVAQETTLKSAVLSRPTLTDEQMIAYKELSSSSKPGLLFGVTGSGKTEVYVSLIIDALEKGKQTILLSPEIFLAEHLLPRLEKYISREAIAVLHSKRSVAEERETWRKIRRKEIRLIVGARSALFAPLSDIGVVILDEEHEWTYKNEQAPRYHAREVAEALCKESGAKLILGSATPSLETWARAQSGQYQLSKLKERFSGSMLPDVHIIDLATSEYGKHYPLTKPLIEAIEKRLNAREQSILFLNKRGMASSLLCLNCRRRIVSPDSQLPFTVHQRANGRPYLLDHTSGLEVDVPERCPHCQSTDLKDVGAGTQRIESHLRELFPKARIRRADSDALNSLTAMQDILQELANGTVDILIGTQMVTKGLDLASVTLAAVLVADVGMSLPHFRAGERAFQLLMQLTGRSGRRQQGEVIIQSFRPDAPEIKFAAAHDTTSFLEAETRMRLALGYPPATKMIRLLSQRETMKADVDTLKRALEAKNVTLDAHCTITSGPTFFSGGKQWHILLRGESPRALLEGQNLKGFSVDIDPLETL